MLVLDEPTAGMAAEQVPELIDLIRDVQKAGKKTILLVEHNMNVVMNDAGSFIEVQGTAEGHAFRMDELQSMRMQMEIEMDFGGQSMVMTMAGVMEMPWSSRV